MTVLRIVPNLKADDPQALADFYGRFFGLDVAMDAGFIVTLAKGDQPTQLSLACEGGSGTDLPVLSIEVDDIEPVLEALTKAGYPPVYGPVSEPWGAKRFYVKDPAGNLINVLMHE